jgi:formate dehydrogenase maturation protein FdhE
LRPADNPFEQRVLRARQLEAAWPFAAEVLSFLGPILVLQGEMFRALSGAREPTSASLRPFVPRLLGHAATHGPEALARRARELIDGGDAAATTLLMGSIDTSGFGDPPAIDDFFRLSLIQPLARACAVPTVSRDGRAADGATCPSCSWPPIASVLRDDPEARAVRRTLACSACGSEWPLERVLCPSCGEERPEKLPRLTSDEMPWLRIEACDACGRYMKGVDLSREPRADPSVDELASLPLDVLATERGYRKGAINLAGT